ncbi:MAG: hypothetical protein ACYTEZ_06800 [Planctomycetota bacterium]
MRRPVALLLLAAAAWPQDAEPESPELHKIYVPYEKLDEVLGTDKERVMVPYKEFLELWKLKYGPKKRADKPPVPFMVESATYQGRVTEGVAAFAATIEIEVFEEAWQRIPLAFSRVAFEEVVVDGSPGVLAPSKQGYDLLLRGKGRHRVEARFVAGIAKGKEYATCAFDLPSVPLHRLGFRVPGKGTEIKLEPARAHTTTTEGDETVLLAFLGPQKSIQLTWRYQPEEKEAEPPLLFATDLVDVRVEERVLRGSVRFDLQILRAPARELKVRVPPDVQVLEVTGAKIKSWSFEDQARQRLRIALHQPVSGNYVLQVAFEATITVPGPLALPVFRVDGTTRERGFLRVQSAEGVGIRPTSLENVFQVDLNTLPKPIRGGERALGFRFPALPYALGLRTERIAPLVTLLTRARLQVERRTIKLDEAFHFTVERAGLFSLRFRVPEGITLTDIGDPKLVDSWRLADGILTLDLKGRRIGGFTLPIRAEAPLDLAAGTLEVPLLRPEDVDREEGTLGVYMDPGIKASATTTAVVPMEPAKLRQEDRFKAPLPAALPLAFAWRWRGGEAAVTFKVEARKPKVTCDVHYSLQAEEARVRVRAELNYHVQYSGVEKFRFRVPKRIVERLKVEGRNLREKPHVDDPVEEGQEPTSTYTVSLQGPALGRVVIQAEYDEVFPKALQVNQSRPVAIPRILPLDVERANTYVAIRKAPAIKVDVTGGEYEQIDAAELPQGLRTDDVFLSLRRFDEPEPFPLELTKHEYQPVADLVVRHAHLKTVIANEERATTTAFFEILNNDRQFLAIRLPGGSDVLDLRVAGKPEKPRLGGDGEVLLVRLETGLRKDASFQVAIAYTHPIETHGWIFRETVLAGPMLPRFEETAKPFQALLTWTVHYPKAWRVTGHDGNVQPADEDAAMGSWLRRAIDGLGNLVRPTPSAKSARLPLTIRALSFRDIVPTPTQRESASMVFTNGTGDGELTLSHAPLSVRIVLTLLALAVGAAAVVRLSRTVRPLRAGGALALVALILLSFAGPAWIPLWNGMLVGCVLATIAVIVIERRRVKA